MSGYGHTSFFNIPFPYTRNQVIRAGDAQMTAQAIDDTLGVIADMGTLNASQAAAAVSLDNTTQTATVAGSTIVLIYDTPYYDTANLVNLTAANDRIIIGSGRWRIAGEVSVGSGTLFPGSVRLSILANGQPLVRKKVSGYGGAEYHLSTATSVGYTTAGNYIQLSFLVTTGTGSGSCNVNGRLTVQRIGDAIPF